MGKGDEYGQLMAWAIQGDDYVQLRVTMIGGSCNGMVTSSSGNIHSAISVNL